jgi:hypothetical protein
MLLHVTGAGYLNLNRPTIYGPGCSHEHPARVFFSQTHEVPV